MTTITLVSATLGEDGKKEPPLGPLYIASALQEAGATIDFRDFQLVDDADCFSSDIFIDSLHGHSEVVAISCFVDMLPLVIQSAAKIYKEKPETMFILGGPGPSPVAKKILEQYPWIFAVVIGEGEETIKDWYQLYTQGNFNLITGAAVIDGMLYRQGEKIIEGGTRTRIKNISKLPFPAYDVAEMKKYNSARVITTRGCAYSCSFCDVAELWGHNSTYRDIDNVIDEIVFLQKNYNVEKLGIVDDTFVQNRKRVISFCEALVSREIDIKWGCFGRINLMSENLIQLMTTAGCTAIFYGIDSGSQSVLDQAVKRVKVDDIVPILALSARYFEHIEASFIWGYPFETLDDFNETIVLASQAAEYAPTVNIQLHMLSPLPNSPIYRDYPGSLLQPEPDDKDFHLLPNILFGEVNIELKGMVLAQSEIFPGFFRLFTPDHEQKKHILRSIFKSLHQTIGKTFIDSEMKSLMTGSNREFEKILLKHSKDPAEKIGVALALGYFQRIRSVREKKTDYSLVLERKPGLIREQI